MIWHNVEKEGNPTKPGIYLCVLIYQHEGKSLATVESRPFADLDEDQDLAGWKMDDQPEHGLAWCEESGSSPGEKVYLWAELPPVNYPKLPEGVTWDNT